MQSDRIIKLLPSIFPSLKFERWPVLAMKLPKALVKKYF